MTRSHPKRRFSLIYSALLITAITITASDRVLAAEPNTIDESRIKEGRVLFEREWISKNPSLGGDGLGPLHNAKSCVACHHQGGVGGSGAAPFNAKTLGIETLRVSNVRIRPDVVSSMLVSFHPGFVDADGGMQNTLPLHHHGSRAFLNANQAIMSGIPAQFSPFGSPANPEEVRIANATPIVYSLKKGIHNMTLKARLFQRNTPALFGTGIIDQVSNKALDAIAKKQKAHPEISGRPSTLKDGRYGKFGWRANIGSLIDFNDQACAAELGLETRRRKQPTDPLYPNYKNTSVDITDNQIRTLTIFIKALPAPIRDMPTDSVEFEEVARGEKMFSSIGCSVCHLPNLENATGIYSDLLLHDMGHELTDINAAEPFRIRFTPVVNAETTLPPARLLPSDYLGGGETISTNTLGDSTDALNNSQNGRKVPKVFLFKAAEQPQRLMFVNIGRSEQILREKNSPQEEAGKRRQTRPTRTLKHQLKITIEPTNFMQEWRTPPLWGVKDSAPYMHDGRAATLLEAVSVHEGEATGTRDRFLNLPHSDRSAIIKFMETLVAPTDVPKVNL